jgi:hypothetical protein
MYFGYEEAFEDPQKGEARAVSQEVISKWGLIKRGEGRSRGVDASWSKGLECLVRVL